jgi:putative glutamine amidotransferase
MMETTPKTDPEVDAPADPAPKPRRWRRWLVMAAATLAFVYLGFRIGFPIWIESRLPEDAPRIAFSPNDTWLKTVGINEAYQLTFTLAEGRLVEITSGDTGTDPERIAAWLKRNRIDGVLLAGGGDVDPKLYGGDSAVASLVNRQRDDFEIALIRVAMEKRLPILGVCRGCQILNVALGGSLRNLMDDEQLADQHFNLSGHPIDLAGQSRLAQILKTNRLAKVKSFHFQAVQKLGQNLRITAIGPGGVVEAIEGTGDSWILAVQWHPELEVGDPQQEKILKAFVDEAKKSKR